MFRSVLLFLLILVAVPLAAEEADVFRFGGDIYTAGQDLRISGESIDDLFAAGDNVATELPVAGTAHLIGRSVLVGGPVGQSVYAIGQNVDIRSDVAGDIHLLGETLTVTGDTGGDIRAAGQRVILSGNVADAVLVAGETVEIGGVMAGDVSVAAERLQFGEDARIEGRLAIYSDDPENVEVPASVIAADRIDRHQIEEWEGVGAGEMMRKTWWAMLREFIGGIVILTLAAVALAAVAPEFLAGLRARALEMPLRSVWMGFLALSAAAGSAVLFALTGIGLLLVPLPAILAVALGIAGYVIGAYILGVGLLGIAGRPVPDDLAQRAVAALVGALVASVIGLVPFIGWLFALVLALLGSGALIVRFFAPGFYTEVT